MELGAPGTTGVVAQKPVTAEASHEAGHATDQLSLAQDQPVPVRMVKRPEPATLKIVQHQMVGK